MLIFGLLWRAGLLVAGLIWCKEILGRFRENLAELKTPDATRRGVILLLWAVTALIIALIAMFVWGLIANIVHAF